MEARPPEKNAGARIARPSHAPPDLVAVYRDTLTRFTEAMRILAE